MYLSIQRQWVVLPDGGTEADSPREPHRSYRSANGQEQCCRFYMQLSIQLIHSVRFVHSAAGVMTMQGAFIATSHQAPLVQGNIPPPPSALQRARSQASG